MTSVTLALIFASVSQTFFLPKGLISAICWVESNHKVGAVNADDGGSASHGVCQMKLATAHMLGYKGNAKRLQQPSVNAYWAGKYLRYQFDRYGGDHRKAVAAYNAGKHRFNAKGQTMNRKYVAKVFKAWAEAR